MNEGSVSVAFLSVVIPVKDEEENVLPQLEEIRSALSGLTKRYEVVYVDDGSTDSTLERLVEARARFPELRILKFERNCGQTAALDAGIRLARGQWVALLDGDRQNDPADIPRLLAQAEQGFDMVAGWREQRRDTFVRRISSRIANTTRDRMLHDGIRDTGCTLKVFRRECIDPVKLFTGMHRFLPALFQIEGFRVTQMAVHHRPRAAGKAKYGIWNRLGRSIHDLMAVRWMQRRALKYRIEREW